MTYQTLRQANSRRISDYFRWLVVIAGGVLLILSGFNAPTLTVKPWFGLLILFFIAFQAIFPFRLFDNEFNLVHLVSLVAGMLFGAPTAAWTATLGMLLGSILRGIWLGWPAFKKPNWGETAFGIGLHNLALVLALLVTGRMGGIWGGPVDELLDRSAWPGLMLPMLLFALLYSGLFLVDFLLRRPSGYNKFWDDLFALGQVEILPLPLILIAILAYPSIGTGTLVLLGGVPSVLTVLLYRITSARAGLERRVKELSTLNQVSQVLRSSLGLEKLLSVIHQEVSQLMGVENFYVALYNAEEGSIRYPFAVKNNERQYWPPRPLEDRLTDRVILQRKPILLTPHGPADFKSIDLPPSEVTPTSWMGVPLISSERGIGCLAVFSLSPQARFSQEELELLMILSGQASVAIENTLLYEQARSRAAQLETLNQISALITSSLDLDKVLDSVCQSVTRVAGVSRSAIFLLDPEESQVHLACAYALSDEFQARNQTISIASNERARCLRTGQPNLVEDLDTTGLDAGILEVLNLEGIQAYGDFPLSTPEGQTGFLSVFFDAPHRFGKDEVELLQTFASEAALAVSNARLYARTDLALSRRVHQLAILEAVGRELSASIHSDLLFERILNYAREFTHSPWGSLGLYNPATQSVEIKASHGYSAGVTSYPVSQGITGRSIRNQQAIVSEDVRNDPDYIDLTGSEARSQISVPLTYEGRVLGVLTLESPEVNGYTQTDQELINQLGTQAAVAVANAELFSSVTHGRDRLSAVLNTVEEGILMVELSGRIMLANESIRKMTGVSPSAITGKRLTDLSPQVLQFFGYTEQEASVLVGRLGQGQVSAEPRATLNLTEVNPERTVERTSLPVYSSSGGVIGWMVVLRDITEERSIAQARELITETLVHDLRSPLGAVLGALDVIKDDVKQLDQAGESVDQAVQVAQRGGRRALAMVESLLDISRMQSGKMEVTLTEQNLHQLVSSLLVDFIAQANEYGLILLNEIPPELPRVYADRAKLVRIITNLLDNALKFTPSGGKVILSAENFGTRRVAVKVCDTGPGIPVEYREKIFERFNQIPGQRGRRRGSGLGLTFCRLAVEAHSGRIWVEAMPGGGSVFTFTLPCRPVTVNRQPAALVRNSR